MREQLIALLGQRVGLDEEKSAQAVDTVLGFLKEHPDKLQDLLGEHAGGVGKSLGKLFGR